MTKKTSHCCTPMAQFIDDPRLYTEYSPRFRSYYIKLHYQYGVREIFYCPWCGTNLPKGLFDEYLKILEKEYQIDDPIRAEETEMLPEEFQSDEWWKRRNY